MAIPAITYHFHGIAAINNVNVLTYKHLSKCLWFYSYLTNFKRRNVELRQKKRAYVFKVFKMHLHIYTGIYITYIQICIYVIKNSHKCPHTYICIFTYIYKNRLTFWHCYRMHQNAHTLYFIYCNKFTYVYMQYTCMYSMYVHLYVQYAHTSV